MGFHDIQKTGSQLPVASLSPSGGEQLKTLEVIWFKSELPVKGQISDKNYLQHFFNPLPLKFPHLGSVPSLLLPL